MTELNGASGQHGYGGGGRSARLDRVLAELVGQVPEIEAASVVSFDGLPMASALPPGMDEDRVAAMSAALLSLGERAADGLGRGELSQVYVEGENGTVFLVSADDEAVLVAVAAKGAKVGLMLFEVRRAAAELATVLRVEATWEPPAAELPEPALPEPALSEPELVKPVGYDVDQAAPLHVVAQGGWSSSEVHGSLAPTGAAGADVPSFDDEPRWS